LSVSRIFGVAGNPVFQSKSPVMFNAAFREFGIDGTYIRCAANTADEVIAVARETGMDGLNITSPFKTEIVAHLDQVEGDARIIGSVNTVVRRGERFIGYNTDVSGILGAVRSSGLKTSQAKAVVVGAGGAARAAVLALKSVGADVVITNRTFEKAREAGGVLGCTPLPMERMEEALKGARILISAVSTDVRVIDPALLKRGLIVLDANYARPTALTKDATQAGCTIIDGREWLLAQAAPAFALFTERQAPEDLMRKVLWKRRVDSRSNIALIGFMGSGKSVVANHIAALTGMAVIDIDKRIEEKAGLSVAEIFEKSGEAEFRRMEQAEIDEVRLVSGHVVSCGGGAILSRANVRVLRNNCLSVWLWVNVKTALSRVGSTATRPLLHGADPETTASALLAGRNPCYARTCDLLVNTEGKLPEEIAERIWHEVHHAFED
jgi:shikimate dehydrogenase